VKRLFIVYNAERFLKKLFNVPRNTDLLKLLNLCWIGFPLFLEEIHVVNSPFKFLATDVHQFSTDTFFLIPHMTTADGIIIPISLTADWPFFLLGNWPFKNPRGPLPLRMESAYTLKFQSLPSFHSASAGAGL
jgi:hypothetical protein